jgi:hypothetical protein
MKYYSIRVVHAHNREDAIEKVEDQMFDDIDPVCDAVMTLHELRQLIDSRVVVSELYDNTFGLYDESGQCVESDFDTEADAIEFARFNDLYVVENFNV